MDPYAIVTLAISSSVFLCACSVMVVYFLMNRSFSKYILNALSMLAVGTLIGDALFHLIPKAFGLHDDDKVIQETLRNKTHQHKRHGQHHVVYKTLLIVGSIYFFYLLNWIMTLLQCDHGHSHDHSSLPLTLEEKSKKHQMPNIVNKNSHEHELLHTDRDQYLDSFVNSKRESKHFPFPEFVNKKEQQSKNDFEMQALKDKIPRNIKAKKIQIPQVVYMILLSGVLHNTTDGMAIGVAFTDCVSGGLSTTIAVLFHEIPHVIGYFVIIHAAGLTIQCSLCCVLLTYIAAFIGAYAGVAIGTKFKAIDWIFAITAGMFLYVALVQLLPEMIAAVKELQTCAMFICQNVGFLVGIGIMILIATFEDSFHFLFSKH